MLYSLLSPAVSEFEKEGGLCSCVSAILLISGGEVIFVHTYHIVSVLALQNERRTGRKEGEEGMEGGREGRRVGQYYYFCFPLLRSSSWCDVFPLHG